MREKTSKHYRVFMLGGFVAFAVISLCAVLIGQYTITISDFLTIIKAKIAAIDSPMETAAFVIFDVRIPRVILTAMVGAGLSMSGSALQGVFQNPLVSPDLLGVCSGAGFGAALGILLFNGAGIFIPVLSLTFGLFSVLLVFFFAGREKSADTISVVLGGIIVSSIFTALIALIKYTADSAETLPAITFWQMGSFANRTYKHIQIAAVPVIGGMLGLYLFRWKINLLSLGDEDCYTLGVNPTRNRWLIILFATITTAGCVTVSGVIGWIGLVIPHICRKIVGVNHGELLPASGLIGAIFMIVVDTLARNLTAAEVPIGILTALIGAPFFAVIYRRRRSFKNDLCD